MCCDGHHKSVKGWGLPFKGPPFRERPAPHGAHSRRGCWLGATGDKVSPQCGLGGDGNLSTPREKIAKSTFYILLLTLLALHFVILFASVVALMSCLGCFHRRVNLISSFSCVLLSIYLG